MTFAETELELQRIAKDKSIYACPRTKPETINAFDGSRKQPR